MKKIYEPSNFKFNQIKRLSLFLFFIVFCASCASHYRHVEPQTMKYHSEPITLHDCNVEITYRYNILENAKNKKYSRMEKRSGISLLAIRIANHGTDTLYIPEDLLIESKNNCVFPLEMDEAIETFIQDNPILDEVGSGMASVQINANWGWVVPLAATIPSLVNNSIEERANDRFIKEMLDYYLVYSNIPPGATVSGLLALPVQPNTPLSFYKRKMP